MTLRLNGSTSGYVEIDSQAVGGNNMIQLPSSNGSANQFLKNGSTAGTLGWSSMVEDSSGRLLVGTSTTVSTLGANCVQQIHSSNYAQLALINNVNAPGGSGLVLGHSRGTSPGTFNSLNNGDELGVIYFAGADGSDLDSQAAVIKAEVDGTPGNNDMPGRLIFATTSDNASSPSERARITSDGRFLVGTTRTGNQIATDTTGSGLHYQPGNAVIVASTGGNAAFIANKTESTTGTAISFRYNGGEIGTITITTTATAYNTSSDYRLKENVVDLDGAVDRLKQLPVHRFNFIADPNKTVDGFLAHEAAAVVPEAVTGDKDAVDDDGNPIYQGIDQSKLVPLLTAALQEAVARIETLEASNADLAARLTALEAA